MGSTYLFTTYENIISGGNGNNEIKIKQRSVERLNNLESLSRIVEVERGIDKIKIKNQSQIDVIIKQGMKDKNKGEARLVGEPLDVIDLAERIQAVFPIKYTFITQQDDQTTLEFEYYGIR